MAKKLGAFCFLWKAVFRYKVQNKSSFFSASMLNTILQNNNSHKTCFSDTHKLKSGCHCCRCSILASLFLSLRHTCASINYAHPQMFILTSCRKPQPCQLVSSSYSFTKEVSKLLCCSYSDLSQLFQSSGRSGFPRRDPFLFSSPCAQSKTIQTCHQFRKRSLRPFKQASLQTTSSLYNF